MGNQVISYDEVSRQVRFAKVRIDAIIPTKEIENGGYDIYANFSEDYMEILPHQTLMIPTGIASAFSNDYVAILKERGSTGTKGIAQRCGVIDSGFRGEWKVPITNTTNRKIVIIKENKDYFENSPEIFKATSSLQDFTIYPYEKAICQCLFLPVPKMIISQIHIEELKLIPSKRGEGMLGSSQK